VNKDILDNKFKNDTGFTLLEVLIAITILSMLMVSIYSIIDNSTNTKDRIMTDDRGLMQFETGLARLENDIEFMHSPLYFEATSIDDETLRKKSATTTGSSGTAQTEQQASANDDFLDLGKKSPYASHENFDGLSESYKPIPKIVNEEKGSLVFLSSAGRRLIKDSKQSNLMWVRYSVVSNENAEIKDAPYALTRTVITQDLFKSQIDWDKAKEYVVLENLSTFEFNFWDPKREKYVESLREMTEDKKTPRLIKIKLTYKTKAGDENEVIRTYRPIWPKVDTKKALEEKYKNNSSSSGPTGGLNSGSGQNQ
jgi:prepilin-type N-terminal cleavage/methylation domain-containing protein